MDTWIAEPAGGAPAGALSLPGSHGLTNVTGPASLTFHVRHDDRNQKKSWRRSDFFFGLFLVVGSTCSVGFSTGGHLPQVWSFAVVGAILCALGL
jgi:hypothetical protein